jgi:hypothetical protein
MRIGVGIGIGVMVGSIPITHYSFKYYSNRFLEKAKQYIDFNGIVFLSGWMIIEHKKEEDWRYVDFGIHKHKTEEVSINEIENTHVKNILKHENKKLYKLYVYTKGIFPTDCIYIITQSDFKKCFDFYDSTVYFNYNKDYYEQNGNIESKNRKRKFKNGKKLSRSYGFHIDIDTACCIMMDIEENIDDAPIYYTLYNSLEMENQFEKVKQLMKT